MPGARPTMLRMLLGWVLVQMVFSHGAACRLEGQQAPETSFELVERLLKQGDISAALSEADRLVASHPTSSNAYLMRGGVRFRSGRLMESIEDFDRCIELEPRSKPYLWQRGIALYYAGEFEEGRRQFEVHQTVNAKDVENSVWHYLCVARLDGVEAARAAILLIPAGGDVRPMMMAIYQLFRGERTPEEVEAEANKYREGTQRGELAKFYTALYVALYFEAAGDADQARLWIRKAATAKEGGYMLDVARFHLKHVFGEEPTNEKGNEAP